MRACGKRVGAVEVIAVDMRDDDVRHCLRWHTGPRHGGVGPLVVDRLPSCDQIGTLTAYIDEYHASPRAFQQPDDKGCSDAARRGASAPAIRRATRKDGSAPWRIA